MTTATSRRRGEEARHCLALLLLAAVAVVAVPSVRPLPAPVQCVGERSSVRGGRASAALRLHETRAFEVPAEPSSLAAPTPCEVRRWVFVASRACPFSGFPFALRQRPPPVPFHS